MRIRIVESCAIVATLLASTVVLASDWGLKSGAPDVKSAGSLAFGPDGILLVGDTKGAAVFALDTSDTAGKPSEVFLSIDGLNQKVAEALGTDVREVQINDLAVNPASGNVYLSVSKGRDEKAMPALLRVDASGSLSQLDLKNIGFAKVELPNAPEDKEVGEGRRRRNNRANAITDLAYTDGKVLVSGLSNSESPSNVREIPFPFVGADPGTSVEIYHGAHGRYEDDAPVRTFVPFNIGGEPSLLAGFQCTPLVKFPIASLEPGKKVRGTTVAELGNRNAPLDMIVYEKDGNRFLLMANTSRGVMKVSTENIERPDGITERIGGTSGQSYDTIEGLGNVVQLDRLNDRHAVILVQAESGLQDLRTIDLP